MTMRSQKSAIFALGLLGACATNPAPGQHTPELDRIGHIVVIYLENRSFDNLYGDFPGADGLASPRARSIRQVDQAGNPFAVLPRAEGVPFPRDLPNAPFDITRYTPPEE